VFSTIYVEQQVRQNSRVVDILARYPDVPVVTCRHYGEIFNRRAQNFRVQKQSPALILARKEGDCVLPAPGGYGFEAGNGYYFSHMLNCLYDCRYCFLQGMYRSAHYVLFVNYEDFTRQLEAKIAAQSAPAVFYSGYDCDSLAFEPVSKFCAHFIPLFARYPQATLEIRTKSTQVRKLLDMTPLENCVIAMSLMPEAAGERWEHKVPNLGKRLEALARLQEAGWRVALRFEPIIPQTDSLSQYRELFNRVFGILKAAGLHSVSLGEFRMPQRFHRDIVKLYPEEKLFAMPTVVEDGLLRLEEGGENILLKLETLLHEHIRPEQYYRCA
jgi:spore photoproduct lyase